MTIKCQSFRSARQEAKLLHERERPPCLQSFSALRLIGFNLSGTPRKAVDRLAADLLLVASSLLVSQNALQGKVAQSFLKVLQHLRSGRSEEVLQSYGLFYRELLSAGYCSWQDCLLDEVLAGRGNEAAKQVAAEACLPPGRAVAGALACDLDALQKLSVAESTLVSWVQEQVPSELPTAWISAASNLHPAERRPFDDSASPACTSLPGAATMIEAPPTPAQKQEWREQIAGQWQWSAGLDALVAYWARHGCGLTAAHSTMRFADGSLEALTAQGAKLAGKDLWDLASSEGASSALQHAGPDLLEHFMRPAATQGPRHVQLASVWEEAEVSPLLWQTLVEGLAPSGKRIVLLPTSELQDVHRLKAALSQYPRMAFVVVTEATADRDGGLGKLAALHEEPQGWPENVQVCAHWRLPVGAPPKVRRLPGYRIFDW
ncbi:hypothetical protein WJX73_003108 [Symbiochloris irregularis]|uniref:Uncharacterized protein n=1 Tax=Symbiochloris irregularis TaxID=706552 RepID=A0AAW1PZ71_9CHLO